MTGGPQPSVLELRQTREFTAREKDGITHLWDRIIWPRKMGPLYTVVSYLWYGFGGFLAISVPMAVSRLSEVDPNLSIQLALAAIGFAVAVALAQWVHSRQHHARLWAEPRTGDRYAVTADGLRINSARSILSCGWSNIETIINDQDRVVALLPGYGGIFIVKAAFDGQDADGFGAQLVRLWQEHREKSQPESIT